MVTETKSAFGHEIHILANVAGGMVARKLITDMDEAFWDQVINAECEVGFLNDKGSGFLYAGGQQHY